MGKVTRKPHRAEFKARVALEATKLFHARRPHSVPAGRTPDEGDVRYAVCSR